MVSGQTDITIGFSVFLHGSTNKYKYMTSNETNAAASTCRIASDIFVVFDSSLAFLKHYTCL